MIKGVIFDLDGTLLNSLNVWEKVDALFLEKRGIEVTKDYSEALLHMRFIEAAHYTIDRYHLQETADEVMEEWMNLAKEMYSTKVALKLGAKEFIMALKDKGYQLAILTSCHQELFEPCLRKYDLWKYFDVIVEANRVNMSKAQPEIYEYTLNKMNICADECVFFDDVYSSLEIAKNLGIHIIAMNDPLSFDCKINTLTHHIINDFSNIKEVEF